MRRGTPLITGLIALGIVVSGGPAAYGAAIDEGIAGRTSPVATSAPSETSPPETSAPETPAPETSAPETPEPAETTAPAPVPTEPNPPTEPPAPAETSAPTERSVDQLRADVQIQVQSVVTPFPGGQHRLAGADRFTTSVEISKRFGRGVPVAYIATGLNFPDALAAAAAAARNGGPLLLTAPDALPEVIGEELRRLAPQEIIVAGGEMSVSAAVFTALNEIAPTVRHGGVDRFATAELLNVDAFESADRAYIATGWSFPDALAASAVAGAQGAPVYLVDGGAATVRPETIASLRSLGVRTVRIAGGTAVVSAALEQDLAASGFTVHRDAGEDRFETSVALNDAVFGGRSSIEQVFFANGFGFADALAGAALAGQLGAPLYLVQQGCMSEPVANSLLSLAADARVVLGGPLVVADGTARGDLCSVWAKPAEGRITDVFGPRTPICTPGGCTSSFHRGLDLGTGCGRPIRAASSGGVRTAGVVGTFGNFVRVSHAGGLDTGYAHLQNGGILVQVGDYVRAGQVIGLSGATGAATGCHLHFEVYHNGTQIDPLPFMAARGITF
jgi:putative cell wall-binding protein